MVNDRGLECSQPTTSPTSGNCWCIHCPPISRPLGTERVKGSGGQMGSSPPPLPHAGSSWTWLGAGSLLVPVPTARVASEHSPCAGSSLPPHCPWNGISQEQALRPSWPRVPLLDCQLAGRAGSGDLARVPVRALSQSALLPGAVPPGREAHTTWMGPEAGVKGHVWSQLQRSSWATSANPMSLSCIFTLPLQGRLAQGWQTQEQNTDGLTPAQDTPATLLWEL